MTIPPSIAEKYTSSMLRMMAVSCGLGMLFIIGGLWGSYHYDLTSGAAIIMMAGGGFLASLLIDQFISLKRRQNWLQPHRPSTTRD